MNQVHANTPQSDITPQSVPVLQRACACGESAGITGKCPQCAAREQLGIQPKLSLSTPGDRFEQEADRIADRVVSGQGAASAATVTPLVQRQSDEDEDQLQTKRSGSASVGSTAVGQAAAALASGGRPLSSSERGFFEPRLGRNLSSVRIHNDAGAGDAARGIGARAFTLRNHIAFAPGAYDSGSTEGRRLLAHELAHTAQQGASETLRRTCPRDPTLIPEGGETEFEAAVDSVRATQPFRGLRGRDRRLANHVIDGARASDCPMYYIDKLTSMFSTERAPTDETAEELRAESSEAIEEEAERQADLGESAAEVSASEEQATQDRRSHFRRRRGRGGKIFRIDDRDPTNVHVYMKVFLRRRGGGTQADVEITRSLQDGIETAAATRGYSLDIEFVTRRGRDVFVVGVNPDEAVTSGNWVGDASGIAHEAHHLLNLEDRYDYTSHADNEDMDIPTRLHWFREQMVRGHDPLSELSLMEDTYNGLDLNEEDICALTTGDYRSCLVARFTLRNVTGIEGVVRHLTTPYRPQHAALIGVLSEAWDRRARSEVTANCQEGDQFCSLPVHDPWPDLNSIGMDTGRFPLNNPHDQPAGASLRRRRRPVP
jgi:transcription elongation GreA/GreB family factor